MKRMQTTKKLKSAPNLVAIMGERLKALSVEDRAIVASRAAFAGQLLDLAEGLRTDPQKTLGNLPTLRISKDADRGEMTQMQRWLSWPIGASAAARNPLEVARKIEGLAMHIAFEPLA